MFFSIVVPIFMTEKYLKLCLNSIISQGFKDYEVLLIDDGSKDSCPQICDEYAHKYKNIKVIHKLNSGVSDSRNIGIRQANGKYILFLDSDDILVPGVLGKIYSYILSTNDFSLELLICNYIELMGNKEISNKYSTQIINSKYKKINMLCDDLILIHKTFPVTVWMSVFLRSFLINNEIYFDNNLISAEDYYFMVNVINETEKFDICNEYLVKYRKNRCDSATNKMSYARIQSQLCSFAACYRLICKRYSEDIVLRKYFANLFTNNIILLSCLKDLKEVDFCVQIIKDNKDIVKDSKGIKYCFAYSICCIFGYYRGSLILNHIISVWDYFSVISNKSH